MARPRGNRGPEAVSPLSVPASERGGLAVAAALRNDWPKAEALLNGLTPDELETLGSVLRRLGRRTSNQAHHALLDRAITAVREGRAPRPADPLDWEPALEVARGEQGTLRAPVAPAGPFGLPALTVLELEPAPDGS